VGNGDPSRVCPRAAKENPTPKKALFISKLGLGFHGCHCVAGACLAPSSAFWRALQGSLAVSTDRLQAPKASSDPLTSSSPVPGKPFLFHFTHSFILSLTFFEPSVTIFGGLSVTYFSKSKIPFLVSFNPRICERGLCEGIFFF